MAEGRARGKGTLPAAQQHQTTHQTIPQGHRTTLQHATAYHTIPITMGAQHGVAPPEGPRLQTGADWYCSSMSLCVCPGLSTATHVHGVETWPKDAAATGSLVISAKTLSTGPSSERMMSIAIWLSKGGTCTGMQTLYMHAADGRRPAAVRHKSPPPPNYPTGIPCRITFATPPFQLETQHQVEWIAPGQT